ncbi:hypothetical protein EBZ80_22745, partial [bacterium]|nr:hypothetical protein [bacterium]
MIPVKPRSDQRVQALRTDSFAPQRKSVATAADTKRSFQASASTSSAAAASSAFVPPAPPAGEGALRNHIRDLTQLLDKLSTTQSLRQDVNDTRQLLTKVIAEIHATQTRFQEWQRVAVDQMMEQLTDNWSRFRSEWDALQRQLSADSAALDREQMHRVLARMGEVDKHLASIL